MRSSSLTLSLFSPPTDSLYPLHAVYSDLPISYIQLNNVTNFFPSFTMEKKLPTRFSNNVMKRCGEHKNRSAGKIPGTLGFWESSTLL